MNNICVDSKKKIEIDGVITEKLPGARFRVKIDINGKDHMLEGHICGRMRMNYIKLNIGDKVKLEIPAYDLNKGRITYRY